MSNQLLAAAQDNAVHICHLVFSFHTGGLENGVVNLINQLDQDQFRHSIICLTDHDPQFFSRIKHPRVQIFNLQKKPGHDLGSFWRCLKLLRQLKPDICHSRNLAALEYQLCAVLAGVRYRIHGEHGWDMADLQGGNKKYLLLKRFFRLFIHQYICLSEEARLYLLQRVQVKPERLTLICNGVDTGKFQPEPKNLQLLPEGLRHKSLIFGCVGRMAEVKNQQLLAQAFIENCQQHPEFLQQSALVIVGDGKLKNAITEMLQNTGLSAHCWLPGNRDDVAALMHCFDVFVLPSLAEGISNTILEAMACGVPVLASKVGGNPELVQHNVSGWLFDNNNLTALTERMAAIAAAPSQLSEMSRAARDSAVQQFSIKQMVSSYKALYHQKY